MSLVHGLKKYIHIKGNMYNISTKNFLITKNFFFLFVLLVSDDFGCIFCEAGICFGIIELLIYFLK